MTESAASEQAGAATAPQASPAGCEFAESGCRPDTQSGRRAGIGCRAVGWRAGGGRRVAGASAAITEPEAATLATGDVPTDPATGTEEEAAGGGGSKPNRNPDHYGPGGEPELPSSTPVGEVDIFGPAPVNPDHYGPGGEPELPSSTPVGEVDFSEPPPVNPDH